MSSLAGHVNNLQITTGYVLPRSCTYTDIAQEGKHMLISDVLIHLEHLKFKASVCKTISLCE